MTKRMGLIVLSVAALGLTAAALAGDDLAAAEKKLQAAWEKQKSMTAKLKMTSHMEMGGMVMDGKGEGTIEFLRSGGKICTREEIKNTIVRKMGEEETKMEQSTLGIVDGEFTYTLSDLMGQKVATKSKIDPKMTGEPKGLFAELRKDYELKLLPEETVDGMKACVIGGTPKQKNADAPTRMVFSFDQGSGFLVKMVMYGADDKPFTTMTYIDLKFDVKLDPERFKFKAPEGVQVIDQTREAPATQPGPPPE